ncbi:uncharacterized protein LOC141618418 [Silene latifolia]|uniref:uncharacterized protein LOC141618418 n=1 Tax=Silene latifolia TaxID=37657 RepID=UPI003D788980
MMHVGFWNVRVMNRDEKQRVVRDKNTSMQFYFTVVYVFNAILDREPLWSYLQRIYNQQQGRWAIGRDFNCVLQSSERLGGNVNLAESEPFQQCLDECKLWIFKLQELSIHGIISNLLKQEGIAGFQEAAHTIWHQFVHGTRMFSVVKKLKLLKPELKKMNKTHFSEIENNTDLAMTKLFHIQKLRAHSPGNEDLVHQEIEASQQARELQVAKLAFLKQKAKAHWLTEGDMNTTYFHGILKTKRNKKFIHQIMDHENNLYTDKEGIQKGFLDYYQMLLGFHSPTVKFKKSIVRRGNICSDIHTQALMAPVTPEEIKSIIFNIPNDKAPGPDGYSSKFFKDTWGINGDEITRAVMDFFTSGCLLKHVNTNFMTLIPKTERPTIVLQFRLIACCNVLYKCISKDIIKLYERRVISPRCLIKMNLQKVYDTIEWDFLNQMVKALRFPTQFRLWGDAHSMMTILRTFSTFSKASGLNMSKGKYNAYFNGVTEGLKCNTSYL